MCGKVDNFVENLWKTHYFIHIERLFCKKIDTFLIFVMWITLKNAYKSPLKTNVSNKVFV